MKTFLPEHPEAQAVAHEIKARRDPAGKAALHALQSIAEEATPEEEPPPLPDRLRNRWKGRFGKEQAARAGGLPLWWAAFKNSLRSHTLAWSSGLAAACVAILLLALPSDGPQPTRPTDPLRGNTGNAEKLAATVVVVAPDGGAAILSNWEGTDKPAVVKTMADAEALIAAVEGPVVIADAAAREVTIRQPGKEPVRRAVEEITPGADPQNLVIAVEEALQRVRERK